MLGSLHYLLAARYELIADHFAGTMAALLGSNHHRGNLRFVVFDVPVLAGVDLRTLPWAERRERLELLAQAFDGTLVLSPKVEPCIDLACQMADGTIEGLVIKDKRSTYSDGSRAGWFKVKDRSWYKRGAGRFDRRCRLTRTARPALWQGARRWANVNLRTADFPTLRHRAGR